ncbi:hypothetical protein PMY38_07720 [Clostridium tertium]|jgi:hypothetical protein|uniref:hypothetical protein n=1 Tax=Clostridium tertium TaxID=1559 RepID=UPI00232FFD6D|nr:hypothetical protein [Clostridium tertium]MDB1956609.1 hypothetical protein [Clostridium tertium]MDB1958480.1 hypothetical protein [Clostridium tertium]MDB1962371.1 hypothetical protein [Clostridium tertium]MDB1967661.1 hypothetical protein [Clostridium tertium]
MSKKRELLTIIEDYKVKQEAFKNKITEISKIEELTSIGIEKRINELAAPFEVIAQNAHNRAIQILDSGIETLEKKWRDNSTGKLKDSNYQIGLANTIKMIETRAINNKEDFKNIVEVYKDDYNALATIKNLLGTDKDKLELYTLIPKDNREYNKKALNDLRNNIESYINPFNIKDSLTMNLESMINFINTRLKDDLSIIPWEEVQ